MPARGKRSWYGLSKYDARAISRMVNAISDGRSRAARGLMTLYCFSQIYGEGKPCPNFRLGYRTIANDCEVSVKTARSFIERAERDGFLVNLGTEVIEGRGEFTKRTFFWIAEEAADNEGMELHEWLAKHGGCAQNRAHPSEEAQHDTAHPRALSPEGNGSHQSTEYSEIDASRTFADANALASVDDSYYTDYGLEPPVPIPEEQ